MPDDVFLQVTEHNGEPVTVNLHNLAALKAEPFAHPGNPDWYSLTTLRLADGSRLYVRESIENITGSLSRQATVLTAAKTAIEELTAVSAEGWAKNTPWDAKPEVDELTAGVNAIEVLLSERFPSEQARAEVAFAWLRAHPGLLAETAPTHP